MALASCKESLGKKGELFNQWQSLMGQTQDAYNAADLKRAVALTDSAILMTRGVDDVLYAKTLNRKALVLIQMQEAKEAESLATFSLEEAEKTGDSESISDALNVLGNFYANQGDVIKATGYYERSLAFARQIKDPMGEGAALNNLATCTEIGGYYPEALRYYNEALKVYDSVDSTKFVAGCYSNIAVLHYEQKDYKQAIAFQKRANEINEILNIRHRLIYGYDNFGAMYLANNQLDSAIFYHSKSLSLVDTSENDNPMYLVNGYSHLSDVYRQKKEFEKALEYSKKALAVVNTIENPFAKASVDLAYSKALFKNGRKVEALHLLRGVELSATEMGMPGLQLDVYDAFKTAYKEEGNFKDAFEYAEKWQTVKDTILNQERVAAIERENTRFKVFEKDKQISEQKLTNLAQQRWISFLLFGLLGALLLTAIFYYRSQSMKSRSLYLENEKLLLEEANERLLADNKELLITMEALNNEESLTNKQIEEMMEQTIVFSTKNRMSVPLKCKEIKYIEQVGDYSWVVPLEYEKRFQIRGSMKAMEEFLAAFPCFVKVQQSYIVNLQHVVEGNRSRLRIVPNMVNSDGKIEAKEVVIRLGRDYQDMVVEAVEGWKKLG